MAAKPRAPRTPKTRPTARSLTVKLPVSLICRLKAFSGSRNEPVCKTIERAAERELDGFYFATRDRPGQDSPADQGDAAPRLKIG